MTSSTIFTVDTSGVVTRMRPGAPALEDDIQSLIANCPDLVGGEGELLSICREAGIADSEGGTGRWSLDNLFVTRTGIPVLVECKRAADPRIRREVVAQMFEYAANCSYWLSGNLFRLFVETCKKQDCDPTRVLSEFLGDEITPDDFWASVDANIKSGRMRLLFVADKIPSELARIVEFLNEQMRAEVLAVELNWFVDTGGARVLLPRIIGATQRAEAQRKTSSGLDVVEYTQESWIETFVKRYGDRAVNLAQEFFNLGSAVCGYIVLKNNWANIRIDIEDGKSLQVLGLYPKGQYAINLQAVLHRPKLRSEDARWNAIAPVLEIAGPLSTGKLTGYPSFSADAMLDPERREQLVTALANFVDLCR